MEREKELVKLINVLRRTSRMALQSEWTGGKDSWGPFNRGGAEDAEVTQRRVFAKRSLYGKRERVS